MRKIEPVWTASTYALGFCYGVLAVVHSFRSLEYRDGNYAALILMMAAPFVWAAGMALASGVLMLAMHLFDSVLVRFMITLTALWIFAYYFHFDYEKKQSAKRMEKSRAVTEYYQRQLAEKEAEERRNRERKAKDEKIYESLMQRYEEERAALEEERKYVDQAPSGVIPDLIKVADLADSKRELKVTNVSERKLYIKVYSVETYLGPSDVTARDRYRVGPKRTDKLHHSYGAEIKLKPGESKEIFLDDRATPGKLEFVISDADTEAPLFRSETAFYPIRPNRRY